MIIGFFNSPKLTNVIGLTNANSTWHGLHEVSALLTDLHSK